jgi:hypothetical protein
MLNVNHTTRITLPEAVLRSSKRWLRYEKAKCRFQPHQPTLLTDINRLSQKHAWPAMHQAFFYPPGQTTLAPHYRIARTKAGATRMQKENTENNRPREDYICNDDANLGGASQEVIEAKHSQTMSLGSSISGCFCVSCPTRSFVSSIGILVF